MNRSTLLLLFTLLSYLMTDTGCRKGVEDTPVIATSPPTHVNSITSDADNGCNTDGAAFFSCSYDNSYPMDGAEILKDYVEFCFANVEKKATLVSPADRYYLLLPVYSNALGSTFMTTGISPADFDTLRTDYLFQNYSPGDYYLNVFADMNCIFFRCVNGNYGLIKIKGVVGNGEGGSPFTINFDVKYVEKGN